MCDLYVYGCGGSERRDFESFLRGGDIYWASRWWYAVLDAFLDAFRSTLYLCELTDSFYITCKTLHEKQQTLQNRFLDDCITSSSSSSIGTLLSQRWIIASSFRVEHRLRAAASNSSSTLYIYIERETPATFALFAYIIIIVSSKTRAALRRWTSTRPSRRRLAL